MKTVKKAVVRQTQQKPKEWRREFTEPHFWLEWGET
jgi:hypothetical protein